MNILLLVVNYNGDKFLPTYLPDLVNFTNDSGISLLVTDDQSTDGSINYLKGNNISFIQNNGQNHGFAANVNNGLRFAKSLNEFDYFIIANNDVTISSFLLPTLKNSIAYIIKRDSRLGILGFNEMFFSQNKDFLAFDYSAYIPKQLTKTNFLAGCFFLITKRLIDEIGYMDEEYFMYGEDNDYFIRTQKAGFSIYNTNLPVLHYSEGSSVNIKLTSWYVYRNAFLFAQKNLGLVGCIRIFISFLNQIYNPFYKPKDPGNFRVIRNGVFYNTYLLIKSILWNIKYYYKKRILFKKNIKY